jgi:hypothetical protein
MGRFGGGGGPRGDGEVGGPGTGRADSSEGQKTAEKAAGHDGPMTSEGQPCLSDLGGGPDTGRADSSEGQTAVRSAGFYCSLMGVGGPDTGRADLGGPERSSDLRAPTSETNRDAPTPRFGPPKRPLKPCSLKSPGCVAPCRW